MDKLAETLHTLDLGGNMRRLPADAGETDIVDLSSNDYLGLADDIELRQQFIDELTPASFFPTSSASRLLATKQNSYNALEKRLGALYERDALLFNSGYHANTGLVSALGGKDTLFVADRLVHASIIDGLILSGSHFERYRHNDYDHLERIITRYGKDYARVVVITESVFSMDGDFADIDRLVAVKRLHKDTLLYVDEAHAIGVVGPGGLGLVAATQHINDVDIIVGTFGKALASYGAFAVMSPIVRQYMINKARSFIFSTAIPPAVARWSLLTLEKSLTLDARRSHLQELCSLLSQIIATSDCGKKVKTVSTSHIQPLVIGDASQTVALSHKLREQGFRVLPIRTPTVPKGTERLRFSLSASLSVDRLLPLRQALCIVKHS